MLTLDKDPTRVACGGTAPLPRFANLCLWSVYHRANAAYRGAADGSSSRRCPAAQSIPNIMSVYLTSACAYPSEGFGPRWLLSRADEEGLRLCTADPVAAECILFVETHPPADPYFFSVRRHPLFRKFRRKCVLYHDADLSVTAMRTISPSIECWQYDSRHKRSAHYVARIVENDAVNSLTPDSRECRRYLYSFQGSTATHQCRRRLFAIRHDPEIAMMRDTAGLHAWHMGPDDKATYEREYLALLQESYFILCPRGVGPCSYRLFESMQQGRAPVIISDQWCEIPEVRWSECSIRVPEADVQHIPSILRERRAEAVALGCAARRAWEKTFSPAASLRALATAALELVRQRYRLRDEIGDLCQFRHPWHFRNLARYYWKRTRSLGAR